MPEIHTKTPPRGLEFQQAPCSSGAMIGGGEVGSGHADGPDLHSRGHPFVQGFTYFLPKLFGSAAGRRGPPLMGSLQLEPGIRP